MRDLNERLAQNAAELINGGEFYNGQWYSDGHRSAWRKAMRPSAERITQLEAMLEDCLIYFEERSDVVDGPDGPEPNRAMSMASAIEKVLKG